MISSSLFTSLGTEISSSERTRSAKLMSSAGATETSWDCHVNAAIESRSEIDVVKKGCVGQSDRPFVLWVSKKRFKFA